MVGRKRKQNVKRQPNGRPRPERGPSPLEVAATQPHRQGILPIVRKDGRIVHRQDDPKAESPIGRLLLNGWISRKQYNSAIWWRGIVQRYRSLLEAPKADARSIAGVIVGPWGRSAAELTAEQVKERTDEYNGGFIALECVGRHILMAVSHWVIHERPDLPIEHLKCGLDALSKQRDLTFRAKSEIRINRS